jgi:hypothetical protein
MVWIDQLREKVGQSVTGLDVSFYMDWYSWLSNVAGLAGCDLGNAPAYYQDAVAKAGQGDLDGAYTSARYAVKIARDMLVIEDNLNKLLSAYDSRRADIVAMIQSAKAEGIDVSAFEQYLSLAETFVRAGGRELCVAVYLAESIRTDLTNYVTRWRQGALNLAPPHGIYDIPEDATDILVMDQVVCESLGHVGFVWTQSEAFKSDVARIIKDYDPSSEVLSIVVAPPKVIVYIKSPFPWASLLPLVKIALVAIFACLAVKWVGDYIVKPWARAVEKQAETQRTIAELQHDTVNNVVNNPNLSDETKKEIIEAVTEGYSKIAQATAAPAISLSDIIKLGVGVLVLGVVLWSLSQLPRKK